MFQKSFSLKRSFLPVLVFLTTLILVPLSYVHAAEPQVIKVAAFNNYPVIYKDDADGVIKGMYVDLLSDIGTRENIKFVYIMGTWNEGMDRIKAGEVDLLTSVGYTPERALFLDYCQNPLLTVWGELYTPKSSDIIGILDITDKRIGVLAGDINYQNFKDLLTKFNIQSNFVEYKSYSEVFEAISSGEVDAGVAGITFGAANQKTYGLKSTGLAFNPLNIYFATSKGDHPDLIITLDKYLTEWKHQDSSTFSRARQKWLLGSVDTVEVTPQWITNTLIVSGISLLVLVAFIVVLRIQVARATSKIVQRDESLRRSEEKLQRVFNSMSDGIVNIDSDKKFTFYNPAALSLLEITQDELKNLSHETLGECFREDGSPYYFEELPPLVALRTKKKEFGVVGYKLLDNTVRWVNITGTPYTVNGHPDSSRKSSINVLITITDITERKESQKLLQELNARNEAILDCIGDAVFACDLKGAILLFNKESEELTGVKATEAIGSYYTRIINFINERDGTEDNFFVMDALQSNKPVVKKDSTVILRKDGTNIPVAGLASPVRDITGSVIGCVVVLRDVTQERLVDRAKSDFVSLVSHQLRTPLTAVNWYSEMLLSSAAGKIVPQQKKYIGEILVASKRMLSLINSILNTSRLEMGTLEILPEPVDLTNVARNCIKDFQPQLRNKEIELTEKFDAHIKNINLDPKLVAMIINNLISNSINYTHHKGKILFSISKNNDEVLMEVTDNGIGIPQAQQENIFGKLYRADNAQKVNTDGSGLGLYIVSEMVTHMNGKIWFKSVEGKGSSFYVSFPASGLKSSKKSTSKLS